MAQKPKIDFEELNQKLLARSLELLQHWFPAGKKRGHEYLIGNLAGEPGESMSININTGKWADFANPDLAGGDLISLYAAIKGIKQIEAARELAGDPATVAAQPNPPHPQEKEKWKLLAPVPFDAPEPPSSFGNKIDGKWVDFQYVARWAYRDTGGNLIGYAVRFLKPDGKKDVVPQTYCESASGKREWKWKSFPTPRPLYGLEYFKEGDTRPVLVVEGEKAADAARELVGERYVVVSWPGGGKAVKLADWRWLHGRRVHLWPDADCTETYPNGHPRAGDVMDYWDQPGPAAMKRIAIELYKHCSEIKLIDVKGQPDGWDAADAVAEGWTWDKFYAWAKPRVQPYKPADVVDLADKRKPPAAPSPPSASPPSMVSQRMSWDELGLTLTGNGAPIANLDNTLRLFEKHPELANIIRYDEFFGRYFHKDGHEWADVDELNVAAWIQRHVGVSKITDDLVHKAAVIIGRRHKTNEPRDWMESLKWDEVERLPFFFEEVFGAESGTNNGAPSEYLRAASANFWISMVARVYRPGCKVDNMVVLEGGQGKKKSTAIKMIAGEKWYTESSESVMSSDFYMVMTGKLIIEIAELDAFSRAEVNTIKKVVTCATDRYRAPYARAPADYPRRCVFVGTTNEKTYLRDSTGARRFWPVRCGEIRVDLIEQQREQLFAEAVARFKRGDSWWEMPREETEHEQEQRRQTDTWEEALDNYLVGKTEITMAEVLTEGLKIDIARQDKGVQMRAANVLRVLGWERPNIPHREGRKLVRYWVKKDRLI